jgi:hypothetical protein
MGAKTWMLVSASGSVKEELAGNPELDREGALELAGKLFPRETLTPGPDGDLSFTSPPDDELYVGRFGSVSVVAAKEFGVDCPSQLDPSFLAAASAPRVYLHAMHSVVDWFAYAVWQDGRLVRSLSLSPDDGVIEDIGPRLPFEEPYWSGQHPAVDPEEEPEGYPFPFHPLDLGEAALRELFGYQIEGLVNAPGLLKTENFPLLSFKRSRSRWWEFWRT